MRARHTAPLLADAPSDTPVVLISGARQSGKSTPVQSLADPAQGARQYLTLDDAVVLNAVKSDPTGLINRLQGAVTLDEVQRAPQLILAIKAAVGGAAVAAQFDLAPVQSAQAAILVVALLSFGDDRVPTLPVI